jgi:putative DNA methylase
VNYDKSFIEVQFPVSKVSKESYKERKANLGQTLTGLGKWWGRKPLVLVRAALLGLLLPVSDEPKKDMDIFLKIMSMDKNGLLNRKTKSISAKDTFNILTTRECEQYFAKKNGEFTPSWKAGITAAEKATALEKAWNRMSYDQKLTYCMRPEEYANESPEVWKEINAHLGTKAANLKELVAELGKMRFGREPIVGDCFCGGGSVPFEAARMGCDVFASDLNPIAGLLTWADLNIAGASDEKIAKLREFQQKVYNAVDKQILEWGIETNEKGERANSYLYCVETTCPEYLDDGTICGYTVPLSPSWVIGKGTMTAAILTENNNGFDIEIKSGLNSNQMNEADEKATIKSGSIHCPHCKKSVPISALRKDTSEGYGLRQWGKDEFVPRESDTFRERLYCIRYGYDEEYIDIKGELKTKRVRYYTEPTKSDLVREQKVIGLLSERFSDWQEKGFIPRSEIEPGDETTRLIRERGWKYWHQLFNPRQLLVHGLFMQKISEMAKTNDELVMGLLGINKLCNWNSKLSQWLSDGSNEKGAQTFYNQAFNTFYNGLSRTMSSLDTSWFFNINNTFIETNSSVTISDARNVTHQCALWITDPPYADAVNYHELSEFFLAWDKKLLKKAFPNWYADSKRVLAVRGRDETFNNSMIDVYKNLAANMPDNGMQIIMFTHQDVSVWADLRNIVWAAGLQVTAAWTIATETESGGLKEGNYVKGTVLLVLRKRKSEKTAFLDEIMPEVEDEVKAQIRSMQRLDDKEEPNFTDADYILAAYAASLKVLTSYKNIEDIDVAYELSRVRKSGELSPVAQVIESAKKIAYDQLIPTEFDSFMWKALSAEEKLYIKGLELEKNNVYQLSAYQELARGFGVNEYKEFMENAKANLARFKTAGEWVGRNVSGDGFAGTLLRNVFMALYLASKDDDNVVAGKNWLKNEVPTYDGHGRKIIIEFLGYIATFEHISNMSHWEKEVSVAMILKELVSNDGV